MSLFNRVLAITILTCVSAARATVIEIQPGGAAGKDAQLVSGAGAGMNFGSSVYIIDNWQGNLRGIGLVEFNLSGVPAGAFVNSATLDLTQLNNPDSGSRFDVFRITSAWNEGTVTFNTAPSFDPVAVASLTIPDSTVPAHRQWDVTGAVSDWVDGTFANHGFWIEEIPVQGSAVAYFSSSDPGTASWRPKLTVDFDVPEPTAGTLLILGLVAFGTARRSR